MPSDDGTSTGGADRISVGLNIDGYDVSVEIHAAAIEREIRRLECRESQEVGRDGFRNFDLSKFAQVCVDPTQEKWGELAEPSLQTGTDQEVSGDE